MPGLTVGEVMSREVCVVRRGTSRKEIARRLAQHGIRAMPVLDEEDRLLGMVSETDLHEPAAGPKPSRRGWPGQQRRTPADGTAKDLMSTPVITVAPETSVSRAARLMDARGVRRLVVVDPEDRLIGIVSRGDLARVFLRADDEIRREVAGEVLGRLLHVEPELVHVEVADGVVTLRGCVRRRSEIPLAVRLTAAVAGVVDVVNRLGYTVDDVTCAAPRAPR
jgi:CBS-domain-containing membrane protein